MGAPYSAGPRHSCCFVSLSGGFPLAALVFGVQDRASPDHAMNALYMPDIALRIGIQDK